MNAPSPKPWSQCGASELLNMAQEAFDRDAPDATQALLAAAQVQAMCEQSVWWESSFLPRLTNAIWEGMRQ